MNKKESIFKVAAKSFDKHRFIIHESKEAVMTEYCDFSRCMHDIFIREGDYIIDVGNFQSVNHRLVELLEEKRKKHPIMWKLLMWLARV